jgi:hypothetical protein
MGEAEGATSDEGWSTPRIVAAMLAAFALAAPFAIYFAVMPATIGTLDPEPSMALEAPLFIWQPGPAPDAPPPGAPPIATVELRVGDGETSLEIARPPADAGAATPAAKPPGEVLRAGIEARYRFGLAIAGFLVAAGVGLLLGIATLAQRGRPAWALAGALFLVGLAVGDRGQWNSPIRGMVADCEAIAADTPAGLCPLDRAAATVPQDPIFDAATLASARSLVSIASTFGMGSTGGLLACLAVFAWPDRRSRPPAAELRKRRQSFALVLGAAAVMLSFAVATIHAFYHWSSALVWPPLGAELSALASTGAGYWGFLFTAILILAASSSALAIALDVARAADARHPCDAAAAAKARQEWLAHNDLAFQPGRGLAGLVMAAGPLATSPLLDALRGVLA